MKFLAAIFLVFFLASRVDAAPVLYANFCPGNDSCAAGLLEASLSFSADTSTLDVNDYFLDILFRADSTAPAYLNQLSFTISGFGTPDGYESTPVLQSASGGSAWAVFYDNVAANATSCTASTNASNEVCLQSGPGNPNNFGAPLAGQNVLFRLLLDLSGAGQLQGNTSVNLRAQFLDSYGDPAGILSPDSHTVPGTQQIAAVPEPMSLLLLGSGLLGVAARRRKSAGSK